MDKKLQFIEDYKNASNASTGSKYDSNANVTTKNIATLANEIMKSDMITLNRNIMKKYLGEEQFALYEDDIKNHRIYVHDESSIYPYCVAISLYPFLLDGLKPLGGTSGAPKHAESFVGGLTNLIFLIAGQFAGAVAIPEFIPYLDHFLRLDYGNDYIQNEDIKHRIENLFQQFVYCVNQPAAARGYQSPFTNIAYFDRGYFNSMFKDFVFPDGDEPNYETTKELQKMFMKWFNKERTKEIITFPVETMNLLHDGNHYVDEEMADFTAEMWSEGHSFFLYNSDSADALSSCCRLKNAIEENVFSYTLGAGAVQTGSKKVITLNINRLVQDWHKISNTISLPEFITQITCRVHKYLEAWNNYLYDMYDSGLLTVYSAGYISLEKQYLTVGFNGFVEGAEFLGISIKPDSEAYKKYTRDILNTIKELNVAHRTEKLRFNTEQTPCENAGAKLYKWDKKDGYWVPENRNLYNSYFYPSEDTTYSPIDKMYLQGTDFIGNLDGGSALHCNLDEHLSKKQYRLLMDIAIHAGCSYFTFNVPNTICNECGHISKHHLDHCEKCGSHNLDYATRIIGYLKRISNFSEARQVEAARRYYAKEI